MSYKPVCVSCVSEMGIDGVCDKWDFSLRPDVSKMINIPLYTSVAIISHSLVRKAVGHALKSRHAYLSLSVKYVHKTLKDHVIF